MLSVPDLSHDPLTPIVFILKRSTTFGPVRMSGGMNCFFNLTPIVQLVSYG